MDVGISHLDKEIVYDSHASFDVILKEVAHLPIDKYTKSKAFHASSLHYSGRHLLQNLYDLYEDFNDSLTPNFMGLKNERLAQGLYEAASIK